MESAAAMIRASYGPLTAAECVLLGSDVAALTCGIEHELLIQPAQWADGAREGPSHRPCQHCYRRFSTPQHQALLHNAHRTSMHTKYALVHKAVLSGTAHKAASADLMAALS